MVWRSLMVATIIGAHAAAPATAGPGANGPGSDSWLTSEQIAQVFLGQKLKGQYASGRIFLETYGADGRVEYEEGPNVMAGRWSAVEGTLCTIYDPDPSGGCFRVSRVGPNCFEFYFVARTEDLAPGKDTPAWTARGGLVGQVASCTDEGTV